MLHHITYRVDEQAYSTIKFVNLISCEEENVMVLKAPVFGAENCRKFETIPYCYNSLSTNIKFLEKTTSELFWASRLSEIKLSHMKKLSIIMLNVCGLTHSHKWQILFTWLSDHELTVSSQTVNYFQLMVA